MIYRVFFAPEARAQLTHLYQHIAKKSSPETAASYTEAIISFCESLSLFPNRGVSREDIAKGIRITHYKKSTVIAFSIEDKNGFILGVFYGGQNYQSQLA